MKHKINIIEFIQNTKRKNIIIIFFIFFFSQIFFLLNSSLFWDDWVWIGNPISDYFNFAKLLGSDVFTALISIFLYSTPVFLLRVTLFLLIFTQGFFLYKIISVYDKEYYFAFYITLLYLLFPFNPSIYTLSVNLYIICTTFFFIASFLFIKINTGKPSKINYILSGFLFFLSFHTNSLLVFYAIPFLLVFYFEYKANGFSIPTIIKFLKRNIIFIALPFLFFLIKIIFLKPKGVYADSNYNKIRFVGALNLFKLTSSTFRELGVNFLFNLKTAFSNYFFIFIVMIFVFFNHLKINKIKNSKTWKIFIFAFITILLGLYPYFAVGKTGECNGWNSRHFLLLPLGLSLFITSISNLVAKRTIMLKLVFLSFVISTFIFINITNGYRAIQEEFKKDAFMQYCQKSNIIKIVESFYIQDNDKKNRLMNHHDENIRFYEYSGMFWKIYGTKNHWAMDIGTPISEVYEFYEQKNDLPYKIKDIKNPLPTHIITITNRGLTKEEVIKLIICKFFLKKKYYKKLTSVYEINVTRIE